MATCNQDQWSASVMDHSKIAPTAHDDEGDAQANPDFDRLLRGTCMIRLLGGWAEWRDMRGCFLPLMMWRSFAQALLDKLLHGTGPFPLKQSTLQLMTKAEQPATAESGATIFTADGQPTKGVAVRGLGGILIRLTRGRVVRCFRLGALGIRGLRVLLVDGSGERQLCCAAGECDSSARKSSDFTVAG